MLKIEVRGSTDTVGKKGRCSKVRMDLQIRFKVEEIVVERKETRW